MAFSEKILSEIVRKRLNLQSGIDVLWTIPEALERLGRKIAANPRKRSLLLTGKTDVALHSGMVLIGEVPGGLLREFLHHGDIWYKTVDGEIYPYPLQPLSNPAMTFAPKTFGNNYYHYLIENDSIKVRNFDINQPDDLEGFLMFSVPRRATMTDVNDKPELQELLIEKVIEILTGPGIDAAEDGEN